MPCEDLENLKKDGWALNQSDTIASVEVFHPWQADYAAVKVLKSQKVRIWKCKITVKAIFLSQNLYKNSHLKIYH